MYQIVNFSSKLNRFNEPIKCNVCNKYSDKGTVDLVKINDELNDVVCHDCKKNLSILDLNNRYGSKSTIALTQLFA